MLNSGFQSKLMGVQTLLSIIASHLKIICVCCTMSFILVGVNSILNAFCIRNNVSFSPTSILAFRFSLNFDRNLGTLDPLSRLMTKHEWQYFGSWQFKVVVIFSVILCFRLRGIHNCNDFSAAERLKSSLYYQVLPVLICMRIGVVH